MKLIKRFRFVLYELRRWWRLIWIYPVNKICETSGNYDAYWQDKRGDQLGALSLWQKQRADLIIKKIKSEQSSGRLESISILDLGCGDGAILQYLRQHLPIRRLVGCDQSPLALKQAAHFGIETIRLDLRDLNQVASLPEVDYVCCLEILEHLPEPERLLKLLLPRVKKGLFFSIPNTGFIVYRLRLLFGRAPMQWRLHPGEHLRFWTLKDLRWWLSALGFKKVKIITYQGVWALNIAWPSLFAAGTIVYIPRI